MSDLYSALSLRTPDVLFALVRFEQVPDNLKQTALLVESEIKSGREFQAIGSATQKARWVVSVEPERGCQKFGSTIRL